MILRILLTATTLLMLTLVAWVGAAAGSESKRVSFTGLENVRAYAAAAQVDGRSYAVDGGRLYAGVNGAWVPLPVPHGVIVNAVAVDKVDSNIVFIGAANRLSVFVSRNGGERWMEFTLASESIGGVTAVAFDAFNRLLYVGTVSDGVYRLRDIGGGKGQGLVASGHLLLEAPVEEVAVDSTGAGLAFVRTTEKLYRAEAYGLRWVVVDSLPGPPTAVAVADASPPRVYAGTAGGGVLVSKDGAAWRPVNQGLDGIGDGEIIVYDVAVNPAQPEFLYAATGVSDMGELQGLSGRVAMSSDGGDSWESLAELEDAQVAELLPAAGRKGLVYALTTASRTPVALGVEPPLEMQLTGGVHERGLRSPGLLAWVLAGHASAALFILVVSEMRAGGRRRVGTAYGMRAAQAG
ncbi:MAG: hypothetical protein F4047_18305 [Caldilineaceae bacterium SB0670_bin_27]|uniref:Exo-alpha-sialidase n=1 Tax=Caldilineaceae bacterium SB0664_bin_27 TaxID=2605260 RepID=A0A6B0YSI4_9CHLR|nr:hypothetical protein [Caldilineaceae bacterium SB0664_bin_27]MYJ80039.1 hypothetical protein [Caldilineaceae bacterium SB0670_bin_27]